MIRRGQITTLFDDTEDGVSEVFKVLASKKTFQVKINSPATVLIEVSNDKEEWYRLFSTAVTEAFENDAPWLYIRVKAQGIEGAVKVVMVT